jgi:hypothetical protein
VALKAGEDVTMTATQMAFRIEFGSNLENLIGKFCSTRAATAPSLTKLTKCRRELVERELEQEDQLLAPRHGEVGRLCDKAANLGAVN